MLTPLPGLVQLPTFTISGVHLFCFSYPGYLGHSIWRNPVIFWSVALETVHCQSCSPLFIQVISTIEYSDLLESLSRAAAKVPAPPEDFGGRPAPGSKNGQHEPVAGAIS